MKTPHTATRQLADVLQQAAVDAGANTPSVRGADWRLATVSAVNADGTVTADGVTVRRLESYQNPTVGDLIAITQSSAGNWLTWGRTATTADTAWSTFTPTWTAATTNPTLGNGTLVGLYHRIGRTVIYHINLTAGSTTTFGSGTYSFALPFQAANRGATYIGDAHLLQSTRWAGQFIISPAATGASPSFPTSSTVSTHSLWNPTTPLTFANGGIVRMTGIYEAGS